MARFRNGVGIAVLTAALAVSGFSGAPAMAQNRTVSATIVNGGTQVLQSVFVAPATAVDWGQDRLGRDTLDPGRRLSLSLAGGGRCRFDVRAVWTDGAHETRLNLDLCARPTVTLDESGEADERALRRPGPVILFSVTNETGRPIQALHARTPGMQRSGDLLGSSILATGVTFVGRLPRADGCAFALEASIEGAPDRVIPITDLCRNPEVTFEAVAGAPAAPQAGPASPPGAPAGPTIEVVVANRSSMTIQTIGIRRAGANDWGPDRLGSDTVAAGADYTIRMPSANTCLFDLRATFGANAEEVRSGLDLCGASRVVLSGPPLTPGRGSPKEAATSAAQDAPTPVTIVNQGAAPIDSLYISSSRDSGWGDNLIDGSAIAPSARFVYPVRRDGQCNYDVRVVFQGGREDRRMRQNICDRPEVAFGGVSAQRIDGGGPPTGRPLVFANNGFHDLRELYLTPVSDTHWGDDRLGAQVLPRKFRFDLRIAREGGCRWDMRLVYASGQNIQRRDVDLCRDGEIDVSAPRRPGALSSTGTGFFVTGAGHILTNHHVVSACTTVAIARPGAPRTVLRMIASDEGADLALLAQDAGEARPIPWRTLDSSPMRAGERVVIVGYPARSQLGAVNVTEGIVSALQGPLGDQKLFQYTAPTQPGNSGGPVMDAAGQVIGVVVAQIEKISNQRTAQNINFAIKPDVARAFLAANDVRPDSANADRRLDAAETLQSALASVVALDCLE